MTEVQVWEEVARRFVEGGKYADRGLCKVFNSLLFDAEIDFDIATLMRNRVCEYLQIYSMYAYEEIGKDGWRECVRNDEGRALGALWLMCEAAEEQGVRL